jgi:hypothetical protein
MKPRGFSKTIIYNCENYHRNGWNFFADGFCCGLFRRLFQVYPKYKRIFWEKQ